jgi:hypothetical protein
MKQKFKLVVLVLGLAIFSSCSRYMAPPFTDMSKIAQIKSGMKVKQISDILEIEPYDVFYMQESGAQILSYNYRLKKRVMYIYNTLNYMEIARRTTDQNSQKDGDLYYDKDYKTLYAVFNNQGNLTSYITSSGESDKGRLIVTGNTIKLYNEKNTTFLDSAYNRAFNPYYNNKSTFIKIDRDGRLIEDSPEPRRGFFGGFFRRLLKK